MSWCCPVKQNNDASSASCGGYHLSGSSSLEQISVNDPRFHRCNTTQIIILCNRGLYGPFLRHESLKCMDYTVLRSRGTLLGNQMTSAKLRLLDSFQHVNSASSASSTSLTENSKTGPSSLSKLSTLNQSGCGSNPWQPLLCQQKSDSAQPLAGRGANSQPCSSVLRLSLPSVSS